MQRILPAASRADVAMLRAEMDVLRAEIADLQATVSGLSRRIGHVHGKSAIERDYAQRALGYPQIVAIHCWDSAQGPQFVTLVDGARRSSLYAVYALQADLGAAHLGEAYVFDQTVTAQHLSLAALDIAALVGDHARCIFQRQA